MTSGSKGDKLPSRSPSMTALKMLGKKLMGSSSHVDNAHILDTAGSNTITPSRRAPAGRNRSPSLYRKNHLGVREHHGAIAVESVESSSQINDLIAHSHNPFLPAATNTIDQQRAPLHPERERTVHTHHAQTPKRSQSFISHNWPCLLYTSRCV